MSNSDSMEQLSERLERTEKTSEELQRSLDNLDLCLQRDVANVDRTLKIIAVLKREQLFLDYLFWASVVVCLLCWLLIVAGVWPYWVGALTLVWLAAGWLHSASRTYFLRRVLSILETGLSNNTDEDKE